ncbi:cellulase family glycosylhydrolase [Flavivirga spongiicola]|uniref:Cellulase family glycosylhydrolase n=1 Tax=Flavivirga spongiicola TaxID=421621 RepID=A0ABU7XWY6_9FLAO|nr:cellulase family glycosylhydrolase [Flavivirga sp. MEBiC05379]MDO5980087.1 cellulase family glycosylhydrolase [Flavivirga sp. MEBiC05379]
MKKITFSLSVLIFFVNSCTSEKYISIASHPNTVISESIIGAGVQWSAYPHADSDNAEWGHLMTPKKWNKVFERLDYMKPNIIRVMDQASWRYFVGVEEEGTPIIDFNTQEVKSLYKVLDYCENNNITVVFGEWGAPGLWGVEGEIHKADDPRWINMITKYLKHLIIDKKYTCLKYYNLVNEPDGYWASTDGDWDQWKRGVLMLTESLKENGLWGKIQVAGPDTVQGYENPKSKYLNGEAWLYESTEQLNDILTCYDIHSYPSGKIVRSGEFSNLYRPLVKEADQFGFPFILGELGLKYKGDLGEKNKALGKADPYAGEDDSNMFVYDFFYGIDVVDALIQSLNVGIDGIIVWDLDDAMHTVGDKGEKTKLKRWGMWNILGTEICNNPDDENIRPWFYPWSLMSRYFPEGTKIIKTDEVKVEGLRIVTGLKDDHISIAIINNSTTNQKIEYVIEGSEKRMKFKKYIYSDMLRPVDENDFPVPVEEDIGFFITIPKKIEVPANSFVLLTSFNH